MSVDKETKKRIKEYFSSKKFIIAAVIFLLAIGTGVGTAMNVSRQLNNSLSGLQTTENETTYLTNIIGEDLPYLITCIDYNLSSLSYENLLAINNYLENTSYKCCEHYDNITKQKTIQEMKLKLKTRIMSQGIENQI